MRYVHPLKKIHTKKDRISMKNIFYKSFLELAALITLITTSTSQPDSSTTVPQTSITESQASSIKLVALESCYTPANTAFAFDIDQVILDSSENMLRLLWQHKSGLLYALGDFSFTQKILQLWHSGAQISDYMALCKEKEHPAIMSFITDMVNERKAITGTVGILKELKRLGYVLYIASNESPVVYAMHKKRLANIFNLFVDAKIVSAQEHAQGIRKPFVAYFEKLRAMIPSDKKFIIFVDDRIENVQGSEQAGCIGIHFTNPAQLRRELEHMRILTKTSAQELFPLDIHGTTTGNIIS
jgi:FMN phosphatase YigB (HAD superfamily)